MNRALGIFTLVFGFMTLKEGGAVLFSVGSAREAAGVVIPWVLIFNFFTGFALLAMSFGIFRNKDWIWKLSLAVALLSLAVLIALGIHIALGGAYAPRTGVAMPLRAGIWILLAFYSRKRLRAGSASSV